MVAQNAVGIQHRVDMPLGCRFFQRFKGLVKALNGEGVHAVPPVPVLNQRAANLRGAGGHHISVLPSRLGQPAVGLLVCLAGKEHVHADHRRTAVLRLIQGLDGLGDYLPAPLLIGPDLLKGPLVNAYQDDVPVGGAPALIPQVGGRPVYPPQRAQARQQRQGSGGGQQKAGDFFVSLHRTSL